MRNVLCETFWAVFFWNHTLHRGSQRRVVCGLDTHGADWLKELDLGRLGHVWVPADTVVLGEEAGHADVSYSSTTRVFPCACARVA